MIHNIIFIDKYFICMPIICYTRVIFFICYYPLILSEDSHFIPMISIRSESGFAKIIKKIDF